MADRGVRQFNIYLMTGSQEETLRAYGEQIIPALPRLAPTDTRRTAEYPRARGRGVRQLSAERRQRLCAAAVPGAPAPGARHRRPDGRRSRRAGRGRRRRRRGRDRTLRRRARGDRPAVADRDRPARPARARPRQRSRADRARDRPAAGRGRDPGAGRRRRDAGAGGAAGGAAVAGAPEPDRAARRVLAGRQRGAAARAAPGGVAPGDPGRPRRRGLYIAAAVLALALLGLAAAALLGAEEDSGSGTDSTATAPAASTEPGTSSEATSSAEQPGSSSSAETTTAAATTDATTPVDPNDLTDTLFEDDLTPPSDAFSDAPGQNGCAFTGGASGFDVAAPADTTCTASAFLDAGDLPNAALTVTASLPAGVNIADPGTRVVLVCAATRDSAYRATLSPTGAVELVRHARSDSSLAKGTASGIDLAAVPARLRLACTSGGGSTRVELHRRRPGRRRRHGRRPAAGRPADLRGGARRGRRVGGRAVHRPDRAGAGLRQRPGGLGTFVRYRCTRRRPACMT